MLTFDKALENDERQAAHKYGTMSAERKQTGDGSNDKQKPKPGHAIKRVSDLQPFSNSRNSSGIYHPGAEMCGGANATF